MSEYKEARKAGKAHVTTKPLVDPMTVDWPREAFKVGMEVVLKPNLMQLTKCDSGYWVYSESLRKKYAVQIGTPYKVDPNDQNWIEHVFVDYGKSNKCLTHHTHLVPLSKIREYEAAQSAQKGNMFFETQVTKQIKETIAAKALREAMDKVKADQERIDGIKAIVALEAKQRENREQAKAISGEIATLSKKWLKGAGK